MPFLSEDRRERLIATLRDLEMPVDTARRYASWPNHLGTLDKLLSDLILRLGERYQRLELATQHGNKELQARQENYLMTDLLVYHMYLDQISEKGLPVWVLPKSSRAVSVIRELLHSRGMLH